MSNPSQHLVRALVLTGCLGLLAGCDGPPSINHGSAGQPWIEEEGGTEGLPAANDAGTEGIEEGSEGEEEGTGGDPRNAADEGGLGTGGEEAG